MTPQTWSAIEQAAFWFQVGWQWSFNLSGPFAWLLPDVVVEAAREFKRELRVLYFPAIGVEFVASFMVADGHRLDGWELAHYGMAIGLYWLIRMYDKDDDDRWKRRRDRAAGAVKEIGGRLVVVPQPATSGAA